MEDDTRPLVIIFIALAIAFIATVGFISLDQNLKSSLQQCHPVTIDDQFTAVTDAGLTDKVVIDSVVYTLAYDVANRSVSLRGQTRMVKVYGDVVVVC